MKFISPVGILFGGFIFFGSFLIGFSAFAATNVTGTLSGDVVWSPSGSPYIVNAVMVPIGASLTIEPGTVVKATPGRVAIFSEGTLIIGKAGHAPVTITSLRDDSIGGDTNNDGSLSQPSPTGDWLSLHVIKGTATIVNTVFRYGGSSAYAFVFNAGATVSVWNSDFQYGNRGILASGGVTEAYDNVISDMGDYGIFHNDSVLKFGGNAFWRNKKSVFSNRGRFQSDGGNFGEGEIVLHSGTRYADMMLGKDSLPYVFDGQMKIPSGYTMTMLPGSVVKVLAISPLEVAGTLNIGELGKEPVTITSIKDDSVLGDTNRDGAATVPEKGDWGGIDNAGEMRVINAVVRYGGRVYGQINNYRQLTIEESQLLDGKVFNIRNQGGLTVSRTQISGAETGIGYVSGAVTLSENGIVGNSVYGIRNLSASHTVIDARNNWWGDASGPNHATNPDGNGDVVSDYVLFDPWLGADPFAECTEECYSNVMFLPGIKASRLYMESSAGEDQLWLPNYFGDDLTHLALDNDGRSVNDVYTRDVLAKVGMTGIAGSLYESFLSQLEDMKAAHAINDFISFAYDWRQSVEDVAKSGTPYADGVRSAVSQVLALAENSKSRKTTIIAHSNGGLLAKAIMLELEKTGQADRVDKIVFVGSPQMGTPMAVLSLLYGYDESLLYGTLVNRKDARELVEDMPGAYGLLPSAEYLRRLEDPLITFTSSRTRYKDFADAYGEKISDYGEFREFLLGLSDGRSKPSKSDIDSENILNEMLFDEAAQLHERLDAWVPPADVEVYQIAGWGLDTVSGVEYTEKEKTECYSAGGRIPSCTGMGEYEPVYEPKFTVDGDKVVTAPSALMLPEAENVKRYWVDLWSYDDLLTSEREHKDLFEVEDVKQFIGNIVTNNETISPLPTNITGQRPSPENYNNAKSRLRMSLYSPLDIHLYDDEGNHTGPKKILVDGTEQVITEEGIPNSYYYQFGDRKYVGFGSGENIRVVMDGYDTGSYTLKMQEVSLDEGNEEIVSHTTFRHLPTTADTTVSFEIPETGLAEMTPLKADIDSDGEKDYEVLPVENGEATLDIIPPVTTVEAAGTSGLNDWFVSDIILTLSASDDGSGVEKTEYSNDDGENWDAYTEPIMFSDEGIWKVQYRSTDKAGNMEDTKFVAVKIDKKAPEAKIGFDPTSQSLSITGVDAVSPQGLVTSFEPEEDNDDKKKKKNQSYAWVGLSELKNYKLLPGFIMVLKTLFKNNQTLKIIKT